MVIVTDTSDLPSITNLAIQDLVALRLQQLSLVASPAPPCEFIVVEGGEAVSEIELAAGFPILTSLFDELPFEHPDFYPLFEIMEEHHYEQYRFYEMVVISDDDGAATVLLRIEN